MPTSLTTEQLTLDRLRFEISEYFSPAVMDQMRVETWREEMMQRMAYRLSAEILAEKLAEKEVEVLFKKQIHYQFPGTVWQHILDAKNDALIWGWLRWVPRRLALALIGNVRMTTRWREVSERRKVVTEQFALFPQHAIKTPPDLRGPVAVRYERSTVL